MKAHTDDRSELGSIRLLQCFDVLMAECSVTRAAARLNLSQTAVSHALARLRVKFGDQLLVKKSGGMTPTARGLELHSQVSSLLKSIERLFEAPRPFTPARTRMRFTVMLPEFLEHLIVPPLVARFEREAPEAEVVFRTSDPERALGYLERGVIDVRLGLWPIADAGLRYRILSRERLVCIARKGHPSIRGTMSPDQFFRAKHVRIFRERRSVSMGAVDSAVAAAGGKLRVAVRVQHAYGLAQIVARSALVGVVPERFAQHLRAELPLQVISIPISIPEQRMALYWHERSHKEEAQRWFRSVVTEIVRES